MYREALQPYCSSTSSGLILKYSLEVAQGCVWVPESEWTLESELANHLKHCVPPLFSKFLLFLYLATMVFKKNLCSSVCLGFILFSCMASSCMASKCLTVAEAKMPESPHSVKVYYCLRSILTMATFVYIEQQLSQFSLAHAWTVFTKLWKEAGYEVSTEYVLFSNCKLCFWYIFLTAGVNSQNSLARLPNTTNWTDHEQQFLVLNTYG